MRSRIVQTTRPGWVYVLTSASLPGCCKIGGTSRTATARASELLKIYGLPAPFRVVRRFAVADWFAVEQATHRMLGDRRLPRSELFEVTPREAARVIRSISQAYRNPWMPTVWLRRLMLASPSVYRKRQRATNWIPLLMVMSVFIVGIVTIKPAPPVWTPHSISRVILMLELL